MKRRVRKSVFETNSSSVHTITISTSNAYLNVIANLKDNVIGFCSGQFGWEHEEYDDTKTKASYLWTGVVTSNLYDKDQIEKIKDNIRSVLGAHDLSAWFEDYKVETCSNGKQYTDFKNYSYIDHSSCLDDWLDAMFPNHGDDINGDYLLWYLFNPESFIHTSNDNDDYDRYPTRNVGDDVMQFCKYN